MCGVVRTNSSDSELVTPQEAAVMPPSVTVPVGGAEPPKANPPHSDIPCHIVQQQQGAVSNKEIPTIDLATDENDDLQKAIALSLQETNEPAAVPIAGISAEEQDMSKALEVSLQDSSSSTTIDIINPQDRKRVDGVPVGLRNIGNSCWFNVVIQPLFFIPIFREMIINYPKDIDDIDLSKSQTKRIVPALRCLFSLLIGSDKKYVDPTEAVNLFQGQEMRKNTQQDVCEFIHKLLEKLEEEFKLLRKKQGIEKESSESSKESDFENPILKLFYGQSRRENPDDADNAKLETFGQYPLTVMKYKDIHESIHASMGSENNEENKGNSIDTRMWFKTLPSVLIFSLSRYQYSKEKKRPEKVHNKFDFPEYLFMDRYMEANKEIVKEKLHKIAKIKEELNSLCETLDKYQKFGSGESKYPLVDILKYALEFAGTKTIRKDDSSTQHIMEVDASESCEADIEMIDTKDINSIDSENKDINGELKLECSPLQKQDDSMTVNSLDGSPNSPENPKDGSVHISPNKKLKVLSPAPQTLFPGELPILQACLPRWQKEVELQVNHLKKSIGNLEDQLREIFEEPCLHHIPYKLHAVVVHEGQASGGHYWVYIFDNSKNVWMKFNDIQVTESNWEELLQDSIGGQNNASAYCLMYIDQTRYNFLFSCQNPSVSNLLSCLPLDLQEYLKQDNLAFKRELEDWDAKQEHQMSMANSEVETGVPATAPNSPDIFTLEDDETNFFLDVQTMLSQTLLKAFQNEEAILQEKHKHQWLLCTVSSEISRLKDMALQRGHDDIYSEPSLLDLGVYLSRNREKDLFLHWYAYEIAWVLSHSRNSKAMTIIRQEAAKVLQQLKEKHLQTLGPTYQGWKKHYQNFVTCTWHFICGYRKLQSGCIEIALIHMMYALRLHKQIKDNFPSGNAKTLDIRVLGYCHRKCLQVVNDKLVDTFLSVETESKAFEVAQTVSKLIAPAMWSINNSKNSEDEITGNLVRNRWCQTVGMVSANKASLIEQILGIVIGEGSENIKFNLKTPNIPNVLSLYKEYKDSATILMTNYEKNDSQTSDL